MLTLIATLLALQVQEKPADDREKWFPPLQTVTLEKKSRSVAACIEAIREQTGYPVVLSSIDEKASVEMEWKDVPVLQALDDICQALGKGRVTATVGTDDKKGFYIEGTADLPRAASHWKQFRAEIQDVKITVRSSLKTSKRTMTATIGMIAQPGTSPLGIGSFVIEEGVDDTGKMLFSGKSHETRGFSELPRTPGEDPDFTMFIGPFSGLHDDSWKKFTANLLAPDEKARTIRTLRGRVTVTFPLGLAEGTVDRDQLQEGKEFQIGSMTVHIEQFDQKDRTVNFVCRMSSKGKRRGLMSFPNFQLVNEDGAVQSTGFSGGGNGSKYTMEYNLASNDPISGIKYKAYVGRLTVSIPIHLQDIPLPGIKEK